MALHGLRMIRWLHRLMVSDGTIGGYLWPPGAICGHREPCMAQASFQCLVLYVKWLVEVGLFEKATLKINVFFPLDNKLDSRIPRFLKKITLEKSTFLGTDRCLKFNINEFFNNQGRISLIVLILLIMIL